MDRDLFALSPGTRWIGRRIDVWAEVDSTNRVAEALARGGAPHGTLVVADRQSAGRGRLGRSFFSPGGRSLYLSLVLRPPIVPEALPRYVFAASVAVAELAAETLGSSDRVEIKWPNDVLLDGRKVSGINLPAHLEPGRAVWAVLGIGVNVNTGPGEFPPELRPIATSLAIASGADLDRVAVGERLLGRLEREIDAIHADGFAGVLDQWRKFFRMAGSRVRVGGPGVAREVEGEVADVDVDGALLLRRAGAPERIVAGDVTLLERRPAAEPGTAGGGS